MLGKIEKNQFINLSVADNFNINIKQLSKRVFFGKIGEYFLLLKLFYFENEF